MKEIDLGKESKLSGKIGTVVAYVTKDGKQSFRNYVKPANPQTPKQMANRMKFGFVNTVLSPLNSVIKRGYPGDKKAYRRLIGLAFREAVGGEHPNFSFNYGKVQIADGPLPLPADVQMQYDPHTRLATLGWSTETQNALQPAQDADSVLVVCLHATQYPEVFTHHAGKRHQGASVFELPQEWDIEHTHFWLYLTCPDLKHNSKSLYLVAKM